MNEGDRKKFEILADRAALMLAELKDLQFTYELAAPDQEIHQALTRIINLATYDDDATRFVAAKRRGTVMYEEALDSLRRTVRDLFIGWRDCK